jgi:hypothetical protein
MPREGVGVGVGRRRNESERQVVGKVCISLELRDFTELHSYDVVSSVYPFLDFTALGQNLPLNSTQGYLLCSVFSF